MVHHVLFYGHFVGYFFPWGLGLIRWCLVLQHQQNNRKTLLLLGMSQVYLIISLHLRFLSTFIMRHCSNDIDCLIPIPHLNNDIFVKLWLLVILIWVYNIFKTRFLRMWIFSIVITSIFCSICCHIYGVSWSAAWQKNSTRSESLNTLYTWYCSGSSSKHFFI